MNLTERWSRLLPGEPTACVFAGEDLLVGDASGLMLRIGFDGEVKSELPFPPPIRDIVSSRDGCTAAVACGDGQVALIEYDRVLFLTSPYCFAGQVRLEPDGEYLVVLSRSGAGAFLNRYGREMRRLKVPDGARSFALVPETGQLLTLNRIGEVRAWNAWGKALWDAEIGPHAKAIRTNDSGDLVLVSALSFGVAALAANGGSIGVYDVGEAVSEATCDAAGATLLLSTLKNRLVVMSREATVLASRTLPTSVSNSVISPEGDQMLVTTTSGYVHLFRLSEERDSSPSDRHGGGHDGDYGRLLFRTRIFSAYMIMMPPRISFARDNKTVLIAGGGGRTTFLDQRGEIVDIREFPGSLLDLMVTDGDTVRIVTTKAVIGFPIGDHDDAWDLEADLCHTARRDDGSLLALSESGAVYSLDPQGREMEKLFSLPGDRIADLAPAGQSIVAAMKDGEIVLFDRSGNVMGHGGPWPTCPQILAAGSGGALCGVGRRLILFGEDGTELWRHRLGVGIRYGVRIPGGYLTRDDSGVAYSVTEDGVIHRAFELGQARVIPFPDSGEGPGFLRLEGHMVSAIDPDGRPRWKFRLPDVITHAEVSSDGRYAGIVCGLDLFVFGMTRAASTRLEDEEAVPIQTGMNDGSEIPVDPTL